MSVPSSKISFGIIFFVMIFVITVHLTILDFKSVNAQKASEEIVIEKPNLDEKDTLVVVSNINLQNIPKIGMIKVVGVINGEGFIKDIPLDEFDETTNKLKVNFVMNKDNEFVSASKPDEFFVCAYHFTNTNNNNNDNYNDDNDNRINSIYYDDQYDTPILEYFDCNEGDIQSTTEPTIANLFKPTSQVYAKSAYYYDMNSPSQEMSFAIMDDDEYTQMDEEYATTNSLSNNNIKQGYNHKNTINSKGDTDSNNSNEPVKIKIIVPMEDKKNAEKIKIMAMLKGQIKSEVIEDVQQEFDRIGGYTIERTFAFDRNTDMGPIQVGDRFHACVIGQDLNPPEGSECEKRLIKGMDSPNSLAVR
ncbi:MAG: hypothetical protein ACM3VV_04765 [Deltaproteobacteria bacterium]